MKKILFRLLGIHTNTQSRSQRLAIKKTELAVSFWLREKCYTSRDSSMEDTADEMRITKEELSFYCAEVLGKPFLTWRKELRVKEAMRMMKESPDCPLSTIAENVGIKSASNFRKQFREVCGMTPAEWKDSKCWKKRKK